MKHQTQIISSYCNKSAFNNRLAECIKNSEMSSLDSDTDESINRQINANNNANSIKFLCNGRKSIEDESIICKNVDDDDDDEDDDDDDNDGDDDDDDVDDNDVVDVGEDYKNKVKDQEELNDLPYPGFAPVALRYFHQTTRPRNWCLALIVNPWFERISMIVILLNCITLGMYQPCVDDACVTNRCRILQVFDDIIFSFFAVEMMIKMMAMGIYGNGTYLADSWNKLDFFIVAAGVLEYALNVENINFSAIRTIRVLRPLRAINRIPSMRILVMLLLDTLPMLGNVLLLCFFVFFIFGIIGVQLWQGILRQRCFLKAIPNVRYPDYLEKHFEYQGQDYICSRPGDNGMHSCVNLPPFKIGNIVCNNTAIPNSNISLINDTACVNWNYYYTECKGQGNNPFQGTISFDNIGLAWVAIFLVISLEGWTDIMYYVQDAHSFWDWIYFVLLIVIGSFFMINLCLVVIATQFSETKKREMERMRLERVRFQSTSTLASSNNISEPTTCYSEIVKYIAHLWRKGKRIMLKKYRIWKYKRQQEMEDSSANLPKNQFREKIQNNKARHLWNVSNNVDLCEIGDFGEDSSTCTNWSFLQQAPRASPEVSDTDISYRQPSNTYINSRRPSYYDNKNNNFFLQPENNSLLSPPRTYHQRRSSVMFSDIVKEHTPDNEDSDVLIVSQKYLPVEPRNISINEKTTQTDTNAAGPPKERKPKKKLYLTEAMTCQELLALSSAFNITLLTGQFNQQSPFAPFSKMTQTNWNEEKNFYYYNNFRNSQSRCWIRQLLSQLQESVVDILLSIQNCLYIVRQAFVDVLGYMQMKTKQFVEYKYFQQGILLAILVNTLSMGVEYHNQPEELTFIVEISNIIFSAIFAVEMLLKIIAEGLFKYISNGFNVFDGIVVVLSVVELCQSFSETERGGGSGLSVLRTFRLLRILKLVRFMPNLRRQLFVMLRTMDNVAVFFSLLVLFIFIFSILGMYLFGGKFCMWTDRTRPCSCVEVVNHHPMCRCDRKHFNDIIWALVTVFQILTQEDWNVVLFNGMQKTSHWAALYFVALMTFGNYVLFNLLVAILVEGFSSERNERREREQREISKLTSKDGDGSMEEESKSNSSQTYSVINSDNYTQDWKNYWENIGDPRRHKNWDKVKCICPLKTTDKDKYFTKTDSIKRRSVLQKPLIIQTAATPQDSPNMTHIVTSNDLYYNPTYPMNLSVESIDRSSSQCSVSSDKNNVTQSHGNNKGQVVVINNYIHHNQRNNSLKFKSLICNKDCDNDNFFKTKCTNIESASSMSINDQHLLRDAYDQSSKIILNKKTASGSLKLNGSSEQSSMNNSQICVSKQNNVELNELENDKTILYKSYSRNLSKNNPVKSHSSSSEFGKAPENQIKRTEAEISQQTSLSNNETVQNKKNSICNGIADLNSLNSCKLSISNSEKNNYATQNNEDKNNDRVSYTNLKCRSSNRRGLSDIPQIKKLFITLKSHSFFMKRDAYALYIFSPKNKFRVLCQWLVDRPWFDNVILAFIALNCITLAMERPTILPDSRERLFLITANYIFTAVFAIEMFIKVVASGMFNGPDAYYSSGWNIMDGSLVMISIVDLLMSFISASSPRIFGILRVFRLLRSLRPLRVINRAPGLKLVVQTLLSSLRPIGNIVLICCTFFIIFGILGVQLFKGSFYFCDGPNIKNVRNKSDCLSDSQNNWVNRKYNFDDLGNALMSLFVLSSRDGWVNIMYTGLDAVGVDQQPQENYSEWRLLYFISFILLVGFFVLNMFVGVVVENFHRCREEQEKEERVRRAAKKALQLEKKRRKMHEPPYYINYSKARLFIHNVVTSKYFDLAIAAVIGLNVITMAMEFYMMPKALSYALKIFNYFFTAVFIVESLMKLLALGLQLYLKDKWNQLDIAIVILSVVGIILEELESKIIPINPTIIRVMRVLRIARVLKLLKMAKGIRALLDTVMQALPQVGNLGLLFFLLFFIFAALGVELFGRLECSDEIPCQGLGEHAHFSNFGMAFLTLFRVATGDNWNGIMKDTLRDDCDNSTSCTKNCCVSTIVAPIFFVIFVLMAQFVLVNVVVAVLMKHLEESHKQIEDEIDIEMQLERELDAEQELYEIEEEKLEKLNEIVNQESRRNSIFHKNYENFTYFENIQMNNRDIDNKSVELINRIYFKNSIVNNPRERLSKVNSLPSNFIYNPPTERDYYCEESSNSFIKKFKIRRRSLLHRTNWPIKSRLKKRFTSELSQCGLLQSTVSSYEKNHFLGQEKWSSKLHIPQIIVQESLDNFESFSDDKSSYDSDYKDNQSINIVNPALLDRKCSSLIVDAKFSSEGLTPLFANERLVNKEQQQQQQNRKFLTVNNDPIYTASSTKSSRPKIVDKLTINDDSTNIDVHSVINERRPYKLMKLKQAKGGENSRPSNNDNNYYSDNRNSDFYNEIILDTEFNISGYSSKLNRDNVNVNMISTFFKHFNEDIEMYRK